MRINNKRKVRILYGLKNERNQQKIIMRNIWEVKKKISVTSFGSSSTGSHWKGWKMSCLENPESELLNFCAVTCTVLVDRSRNLSFMGSWKIGRRFCCSHKNRWGMKSVGCLVRTPCEKWAIIRPWRIKE